ncbi:MAG: hypothetical protein WCX98_00925 [Candidatus Dojkabacteria bacterium]
MKTDYCDLEVLKGCIYIPKLDLRIPRDSGDENKEDNDEIVVLPKKRLRLFGAIIPYIHHDESNMYFCLSLKGKTISLHYSIGSCGGKYLKRATVSCFG